MRINSACILLVGMYATNALASETVLSGISVGELGKVQSEAILYKAKAERDKAQKEAENVAGSSTIAAPFTVDRAPTPLTPIQPSAGPTSETEQLGLPVIRSIGGSTRQLQAALLYSSGIEIDATPGRNLPGGFRVTAVTLEGVIVERRGVRYELGFSNQVPSAGRQQTPTYPRTGPLLPGTPSVQP